MDRVCEVDYGGALRQRDNVALRSEHEGLVIEDIVSSSAFMNSSLIDRVVFGIDKLRYPFKLLIYLFAARARRIYISNARLYRIRRYGAFRFVLICTSNGIPSRPITVVWRD